MKKAEEIVKVENIEEVEREIKKVEENIEDVEREIKKVEGKLTRSKKGTTEQLQLEEEELRDKEKELRHKEKEQIRNARETSTNKFVCPRVDAPILASPKR